MTGKLQKKVRRPKRDLIIETTVELFRQTHDIRKVSIEDIAAAAKVSPTTIYNQFGNREALVVAAAKSLVMNIGTMAQQILTSDLPFDQKLIGVISGKIALTAAASDEVVAKLVSQDKNIAPFIEEMYRNEARPLWKEMLSQGKCQGFIDPALDEDVFLEYLDVIRIGLGAKKDLFLGWRENLGKLQQLTNIMFYGFMEKEIDLFGTKNCEQNDKLKE